MFDAQQAARLEAAIADEAERLGAPSAEEVVQLIARLFVVASLLHKRGMMETERREALEERLNRLEALLEAPVVDNHGGSE